MAAEPYWKDERLVDYINWLIEQSIPIIYSSDLVRAEYVVTAEPVAGDPLSGLRRMLEPYHLTLADGPGESVLIVAIKDAAADPEPVDDITDDMNPRLPAEPLTEIVVTSSLYNLKYEPSGSHTFLDRKLTTQLPDVGDDAIRPVHRLPGIASGGVSTRAHVRGGIDNEQLFLFDGLRLYEPYHLKDFHALASTVDQSAIAGIDFYSAGYQVQYGDRMSGVMDVSMREPEDEPITELALSIFNASAISLGRFGENDEFDWLLTGRRGNLDLVADIVNPDYGSPRYEDAVMHFGWQASDRTYVSGNVLLSYDKISIAETDSSEVASAEYRNRVAWIKSKSDWTDTLSSATVLSATEIDNARSGFVNVPDVVQGNISDVRNFKSIALKQDWKWIASDEWMFSTGVDIKRLNARYQYSSTLEISPPFDQILSNQPILSRTIETAPGGAQYAAYLGSRWRPYQKMIVDAGIRWDVQTYTTANDDDQTSLRLNLLYLPNDRTEIRFGVGRYYQAQEINELQVADGVETFFPAQRATHLVASLSHGLPRGIELRLELYQKKYRSLMPRYENVFDSLVLIPELKVDRTRIDASGAESRGAEFRLSGETDDESLVWWLSYTWSSIEESTTNGDVKRSWDQPHALQGGINWSWHRWDFSAAGSVHSGWPRTDLLIDSLASVDGSTDLQASTTARNSLRQPTFHTLDARASRRFDVARGELTAFLEVSNIYDRQNVCCTQYRLTTLGNGEQTVTRNDGNWLPLIPSLGIIWKF